MSFLKLCNRQGILVKGISRSQRIEGIVLVQEKYKKEKITKTNQIYKKEDEGNLILEQTKIIAQEIALHIGKELRESLANLNISTIGNLPTIKTQTIQTINNAEILPITINESIIDVGIENKSEIKKGTESNEIGNQTNTEDSSLALIKNKLKNLKKEGSS